MIFNKRSLLLAGLPLLALALTLLAGCNGVREAPKSSGTPAASTQAEEDERIQAERAKLSPEDRALVEAQEWCVVSKERLGSMPGLTRVMIKDQPVFLCCKGCKAKAERAPDRTLAALEKLKEKKRAEAAK